MECAGLPALSLTEACFGGAQSKLYDEKRRQAAAVQS